MQKLSNFIKSHPILFLILIFLQILLLFLVIYPVKSSDINYNQPTPNPRLNSQKITIYNFKETFPDLQKQDYRNIQDMLTEQIKNNLANQALPKHLDVNIRKNTIFKDYDPNTSIYFLNFIVDIKSISQSFQIIYEYSPIKNNPKLSPDTAQLILCPEKPQHKYHKSNCIDGWNSEGQRIKVFEKLQNHEFKNILLDLSDTKQRDISITIQDSNPNFKLDSLTKTKYINKLKRYIRSIGFDETRYNYIFNQIEGN